MNQFQLATTRHRFSFDGRSISAVVAGHGPLLLWLHGLGGNANNWLHQLQAFSATHRVACLDLPGHGQSEGRDLPFERYWEVVEALLDSLGIQAAVVGGLSKGARVGLMLAARRPSRVAALIVVNAFVHLDTDDAARRLALYALLDRADGKIEWAHQLLQRMGVADHSTIVRGFMRSLDQLDGPLIHRLFKELMAFDQRSELSAVQSPVLLIRGAKDLFVPEYCVRDLRASLQFSRVLHLEECGHLPYLESPQVFNEAIRAELR